MNNAGLVSLVVRLTTKLFARTPRQGARTSVFLAASPKVQGVTGMYFSDRRAVQPNRATQDRDLTARLWALSEEMVAA
jgi:hypothetical protein